MPHQDKNKKSQNAHHMMFIPITGTLFLKKLPLKKEQNSLDFHLDIIKKIDTLLAEHDRDTPSSISSRAPPIIPLQPPSPIEPRLPLNKTLSHQEVAWMPTTETHRATVPITPEEFKTELTINPEFRYITSQEFIDILSQTRLSSEERIEIIDLSTLDGDTTTFHKTPNFSVIKTLDDKADGSSLIHDVFNEEHHHNKIEIIDARRFKQEKYENASSDALKQSEESEQDDNKSQVYYINSKDATDKKQKKLDIEQTYTPLELEERLKDLKDEQSDEEKTTKQLEREREQLRRENEKLKKAILEEKKHELREKDRKSSKKASELTGSKRDLKKQAKEQKRLQRLKIKQARIEKKRRKKEEKLALKLKQKQQRLGEKEKKLQQPHIKQKTNKVNLTDEEEYTGTLAIDDDLRKVLLITDTLLAELPEEILDQFIHSKEFELYEKVLNKYKIK